MPKTMATFKNIFNPRALKDGGFFLAIKELLGFNPKNIGIYQEAFTHRSTNTTSMESENNYERLEFLGDSILSTIISTYLFNQIPEGSEGYLTKMRSKIVSRKHLNELGQELNLTQHLTCDLNIENYGENIEGNLFESLVGAILLLRISTKRKNLFFKAVKALKENHSI